MSSSLQTPTTLRFELLCDRQFALSVIGAAIKEFGAHDSTLPGLPVSYSFDLEAPPEGPQEIARRCMIERWLVAQGCKATVWRARGYYLYKLQSSLDDIDGTTAPEGP